MHHQCPSAISIEMGIMISKIIIVGIAAICAILIWPSPAYAYLDPGTGSAIMHLLIGIGAAAFFIARGVLYRIRRKTASTGADGTTGSADVAQERGLVLFSEGRDYWLTFKPVIEALIAQGIPFRYLTMDAADPALTIENPLMRSRYLGSNLAAFARVATVEADVMLVTTPNIGCSGYPIPRPTKVSCLTFIQHGIGDLAYAKKNALDNYDAVLMAGPFLEHSIRFLEELRGSKQKECHSCGLPYLDELKAALKKREQPNPRPVVLIAPTWGARGMLHQCGTDFLVQLASSNEFDVIIRPHPQSWKKEPELLAAIKEKVRRFPWVRVDDALDPSESLSAADVLISENSGIRYEFAFLYERPAITVDIETRDIVGYEIEDLKQSWDHETRDKIGIVVSPDEVGDIAAIVRRALSFPTEALLELREASIVNFGTAGKAAADWAAKKLLNNPA